MLSTLIYLTMKTVSVFPYTSLYLMQSININGCPCDTILCLINRNALFVASIWLHRMGVIVNVGSFADVHWSNSKHFTSCVFHGCIRRQYIEGYFHTNKYVIYIRGGISQMYVCTCLGITDSAASPSLFNLKYIYFKHIPSTKCRDNCALATCNIVKLRQWF